MREVFAHDVVPVVLAALVEHVVKPFIPVRAKYDTCTMGVTLFSLDFLDYVTFQNSGFEMCFAPSTWNVGCWGAKHNLNRDFWRHSEQKRARML